MWKIAVGIVVLEVAGFAQVTQRASLTTGGAQSFWASFGPSMSADGRYVAFSSVAEDLVPGDWNFASDIFVRDRWLGTTVRVSVDSNGIEADGDSVVPSISADGRYVAFASFATNLVPADQNGILDVFVHDLQTGVTELVSVDSGGVQADGTSTIPAISADGRYVAFSSFADNLVPSDTNLLSDVFVRDRQAGTTEAVSVDPNGFTGNGHSGTGHPASISADGRYVAFASLASTLVVGDTNGKEDVFVRDRLLGTTERVSVDSFGAQSTGIAEIPSISADGRYVAFSSGGADLVPGDSNLAIDVFVRDRLAGTTERMSVDSNGVEGNRPSFYASISADGRFVTFQSTATNLVPGDTNSYPDIFVRDRTLGTTERVSVDSAGSQSNNTPDSPSLSSDGRYVVFRSDATNLVSGDTNSASDIFVRDRHASGFQSMCDPGLAGIRTCPCSNPPSGVGRGCDNSSATGGASITASGAAYLSMDTLVFTTSDQRPSGLSILLQGNGFVPAGHVYGQGVRCVGGTIIRRLYIKDAVGGSITAPDLAHGDPTVSARSAAKGDPISAGESRWYLGYYRDPVVLGGCPSSSTFAATQTGRVTWSF